MKRKIFSVFLTLVLLCSFSLVTAVPAGAQATLEVTLVATHAGIAEWSTQQHTGDYSIHLAAPGKCDWGDWEGTYADALIQIPLEGTTLEGLTLGEITDISWWNYLVDGCPPALRIKLDADGDGDDDYHLVGEFAYQEWDESGFAYTVTPWVPYTHYKPGLEATNDFYYPTYDTWMQTFHTTDDASSDPAGARTADTETTTIHGDTIFWVMVVGGGYNVDWCSAPYANLTSYFATLEDYQTGTVTRLDGGAVLQALGNAEILMLEFAITNEIGLIGDPAGHEVYFDDITINGTPYDLEWTHVSPIQVDDDRAQFPNAPFQTIQGAIDAAQLNDTINVAAGTYYENIIIDESVTIQGAGVGSTIVDGGDSDRVFLIGSVDDTVTVTISGMTIQNGSAEDMGAGIMNKATLTLNNCTVTSNTATPFGGGITNTGTMTIDRCTISENTATGVFYASGGGIFNAPGATLTMTNSTISGNTAAGSLSNGGGIMNGLSGPGGVLTMTNCTVSGNTAGSAGGGIGSNWTSGTPGGMTLTNVTITDNSVTGANNQGGGIFVYGGTNVVKNTIVAGNTASVGPPNIMKSPTVGTWTASNCITSGNPLLGLLQDNGGSTETHALLLGSPAIDTGDDIVCPATDQRGVPRPQGPASSDIGSYEVPYTVYIDGDWTGPEDCGGHVWGADAFAIIQDGINPVARGGTIIVAAGTYNENIVVGEQLTLEGAQAGEDPTVGEARTDPTEESTIQGSGGAAVKISADNVTIDGFQIENPTGYAGIRADGRSYITIKNNIVTNIDGVGSGTGNQGIAIVGSATPITDITIEDNQVNGIKHTAVGRSATGIWIGNSSGSSTIDKVVIQRNTVSNIFANTSAWGSGGYGAYGILINYGAYNTGDTVNAQVLDNTISNLEGLWAHGIGLEGDTSDAVVERNDISNLIDHKWYLEDTPDAVAVMVEDNDVADTVGIHFNNFSDVLLGVWNKTPSNPEVDATNNYWGNASGPTHADNPFGIGGEVMVGEEAGDVTYNPWLLEAVTEAVPEPPTYDKTLALKDGWTLVSVDKAVAEPIWVGTNPLVVELPGETMAFKYTYQIVDDVLTGGFVPATPADLEPLTAIYVLTKGGGGVGFNYAEDGDPAFYSKELEAGWNLISIPSTVAGTDDILSSLRYVTIGTQQGIGLTTLVSQGDYNQFSIDFYEATLTDTDFAGLPTLEPFDGYWANMEAAEIFEVPIP